MNTRQQLYKKYRLEGMSKYASARKAGYSHSYAIQAKNIEKRINMPHLIEMAGLSDNKLVEYIVKRLEATKVISADVFIKDEDGKLTVNKNSNDWIEVPDYHAQHKFLNTILELAEKIKKSPTFDLSKHTHITKVELKISDDTTTPLTQESGNRLSKQGEIQGTGSG